MGFFSRKISVNYEIKRVVDSMLSTARSLSPKIEEDAKNDLLLFLLKQTAADGQVAKEEVQFINEYLGMNGTVSGVRNYLNQYAGYLRDYNRPMMIEKLVAFYKTVDDESAKKITVLLIEMFLLTLVLLSKEIISIDGSISDEEKDSLNDIINSSSDYIEDNLGFVPDGVEKARNQLMD